MASVPRAHVRETIVQQTAAGLLQPIPNAIVNIYNTGTTTPISQTIYASGSGSVTLSNPITANSQGVVEFWLPVEQTVDLYTTSPGIISQTVTVEALVSLESGALNLNTATTPAAAGQVQVNGDTFQYYGTAIHTAGALDRAQTWTAKQTFSADADGVHPQVNLLVNGGFEIWQRGSGPFTANGAYASDRWQILLGGTDTLSVSKDTTHQDSGSTACAACTYVTGTQGFVQLAQKIENSELAGRTVSVSVRVNQSVANLVQLQLNDGVGGTATSTLSATTGSYITLTATLAVGATATALFLYIFIRAASGTAYIDNAMLVVGSAPVNYIPLTPPEEWSRCQRYYEVLGPNSGGTLIVVGIATAASQEIDAAFKLVRKSVTPTITKVGTWPCSNCGQPIVDGIDVDGFYLALTSAAAGRVVSLNNVAGEYITAEANP